MTDPSDQPAEVLHEKETDSLVEDMGTLDQEPEPRPGSADQEKEESSGIWTKVWLGLLVLLVFSFISVHFGLRFVPWSVQKNWDSVIEPVYDSLTGQKPVGTLKQAEAIYRSFPFLALSELEGWPVWDFQRDKKGKFHKRATRFMLVSGFDRFRYLAGHFRVNDFMVHHPRLYAFGRPQHIGLDKKIVVKLQLLTMVLRKRELDPRAFRINSAYRPPRYNESVGGRPFSRHLYGDALDLIYGDINRDGRIDLKDRALLKSTIIRVEEGNHRLAGGLFTYTDKPRLVHMDTRGKSIIRHDPR